MKKKHIILIALFILTIFSISFIVLIIPNFWKDNVTPPIEEIPEVPSLDDDKQYEEIIDEKYYEKLDIKGVYDDNQAYHPKVLSFDNEWNGYKYWMSFTPYPYSDSKKENPHVVVSNDKINWKSIENFNNPLDEVKNTSKGKRYNSDSHLVYNEQSNELECWWRYVDDVANMVTIYRRTTKDGVNWTEKEEVIVSNNRKKFDYVSPAIIFENGMYKVWYVLHNQVYFIESSDLTNWSTPTKINISYDDKVKTWHIDVIHTEKGYEMIMVAYKEWKYRNIMNLYYSKSIDNNNWSTAITILKPSEESENWDNSGLYRSSFIYEDGKYYVFYSGINKNNSKGIGLVVGYDINNLKHINYKSTY